MPVWNRGFTLTWLGHSTFELVTSKGTVVLFDPWLTGNPKCPEARREVRRLDAIALSHAHGDHSHDLLELARRFGCPVVCAYEAYLYLESKGVKTAAPMGKGGTQRVADLAFTMVHATHSSGFEDEGHVVYGGGEAGFVVTLEDGFRIYFAGDTGPTMDMAVVGELYHPELAVLPIGDHYTMGPREAAWAAGKIGAKWIVPVHWGTFPLLSGTPEALRSELRARGVNAEVVVLEPGVPVG